MKLKTDEKTTLLEEMVTVSDLKKRKVSILGTGLDGVKCAYYLLTQNIPIKCFLNNNSEIETFMGYPVYEPDDMDASTGDYVIIAVGTMETYSELSKQLSRKGMYEFKDYVYYRWFGKKLVLLHGNCHIEVIQSYLESSKVFSEKYAIYPNPCICNNKDGYIKDKVLENCDVWIHEDIQKDNKYGYRLSDEYIRSRFLNKYTYPKEIIIPHLFGLGKAFFPQSDRNKRNEKINNGCDINGMFPHADTVIDECVKFERTEEEIIDYCKSDSALDKEIILKNFKTYMKKIKEREKFWNIKIYDFIVENYQNEKLFYDEGHPTNIIMEKISMDILYELGIYEEYIHTDMLMDVHENPVYPSVRHALNLSWKEEELRKSPTGKKMCSHMDFEEYIKEYLQWSYKSNVYKK